jgi:hypothetical protein
MADKSLDVLVRILTEQVGEGKADEIMKKYAEATKNAASEVEKGLPSHHELRRVLADIGNVAAPGAGRALGELVMGPVGGALALVGAFEMLRKKLEDVSTKLEDINQQEFQTHLDNIAKMQQGWIDTLTNYLKYEEELKNAGRSADPLADELKRIQAVSEAQTAANLKLMKELADIQIARLKANGATADQIKVAEEENQRRQDAAKDAAEHQGTNDITLDILKRQRIQPDLENAVQSAETQANAAKDELNRANDDKTKADDAQKKKEAQDKVDAADAALNAAKAMPEFVNGPEGEMISNKGLRDQAIKEAKQKDDDAHAEQDRINKAQIAAQKAQEKAIADQAAADAALAEAQRVAKENQSKITSERTEVGTRTAAQAEVEKGQQRSQAAQDFGTAQGIADIAAKGGRVSPAQAAYLQAVEKKITGVDLSFQQAVTAMELQSRNQDFATQLLETAAGRIISVQQRLDALEARFANSK